tara:strand:- start:238 stop:453 length:216 start_codon:yes stop_codon:yes gene_type:complete
MSSLPSPPLPHPPVKIVVFTKDGIRKTSLPYSSLKKQAGQIVLPPNMKSAGFMERVAGVNWESLPEWEGSE